MWKREGKVNFGDFDQRKPWRPNLRKWTKRISEFGASNSFKMNFDWGFGGEFDVWIEELWIGMLNEVIFEVLST